MIPKYYRLKEKINDEILQDIYPIDSKLPTEIELAEIYHVSRATVRGALELLAAEGIITKKWGSGNIVIAKSDTSKKNTIAIILTDKKSDANKRLISDISSQLYKSSLTVEVFETLGLISKEREVLQTLAKDMYGGIIASTVCDGLPSTNIDLYQKLLKRGQAIVFLDAAPIGLYNGAIVKGDEYDVGYSNARALINQGLTCIGGIFIRDSFSSITRYQGFVDSIRDAALEINDDCFLWCNKKDLSSHLSRGNAAINKFFKIATAKSAVIYVDDDSLNINSAYEFTTNSFLPAKSFGTEAANLLLSIKKGGGNKVTTIPYKTNIL